MAECLRAAKPADALGSDLVFRRVPDNRTYQKDLAKAGIAYKDDQGRYTDFHALRMSYNMLLAKQGVAQELMRHHDIRLTMKAYTDPKLLDMQGAVDKLPRLLRREESAAAQDFRQGATAGATRAKKSRRKRLA